MAYFVTGATGFIGDELMQRLLRRDATIHCLVREQSLDAFEAQRREWGADEDRVRAVVGDLGEPRLGLDDDTVAALADEVTDVFHLAAVYDMDASDEALRRANVEGTRHVVELANQLSIDRFHHVSSIAVAGTDYKDRWREDTPLSEAKGLDHPYHATKHESEKLVRAEIDAPFRIYRPGIVIGNSQTGHMAKVDGPYYFFTLLQRLRDMLPPWFPLIGLEGSTINLVPVDYVADAIDHIAHLEDAEWDNRAFHLIDQDPYTAGEVINIFAEAAHAPKFQMRIDPAAIHLVPEGFRKVIGSLPPVRNARRAILGDLGIPESVLHYINWRTTFDSDDARAALVGSGITVPRLEDYAWRLWDYYERHLDPELYKDRSLRGAIEGKVVMVTGATGGIGSATARAVAQAGAHVLLVSRSEDDLAELRDEIGEEGGAASIHPCDLTDTEDIDRMCKQVLEEHGRVDVLVNNAGRSIRRSIKLSYDRFHDFERTMELNYFGALKLILNLLPRMTEKGGGHIINISSIGVQTNTPRFSAYVASKAALDAFSRCIASEVIDDGVHLTTIHMPLVRTPMIAPTKIYDYFPTISPQDAADMITDAMISKPKKVGTGLGNFGEVSYAVAPKVVDQVLHMGYKLFPDSSAAKGDESQGDGEEASSEGLAFAHLLKGVHW